MNKNAPTLLICATVGIIAGFASCSQGSQKVAQNHSTNQAIADEQPTDETTEQSQESPTRRGDAEALYLEQAVAECGTQFEFNHQSRVFELWDEARAKMAEDGKPAEDHLYLKLDELYTKARTDTRGKTFNGKAESQAITRPITGDIAAIFEALDYTQKSKTPGAPQVNLSGCLDATDALLNEVL